jgi:hypothetical protein
MWRTPVSVFLSAILGSALATIVYSFWLSAWQLGTLPSTTDDLRMGLAIALAASWFTIPGALLLAAVQFGLSGRIRSERVLDGAIVGTGVLAGAMMLGGLSLGTDGGAAEAAALGAFYGLTTALIFIAIQRCLGTGSRQS